MFIRNVYMRLKRRAASWNSRAITIVNELKVASIEVRRTGLWGLDHPRISYLQKVELVH